MPQVCLEHGQEIAGCRFLADLHHGYSLLVCPCGAEFRKPTKTLLKAERLGRKVMCLKCSGGPRRMRAERPMTEKGRTAVEMLKSGKSLKDIARAVWLTPQTVHMLWLRWCILPEVDRLRKLVIELGGTP